jgi:heat shock protein HtpX
MAMNFWEAQRKARSHTTFYMILFFLLMFGVAYLSEVGLRTFAGDSYDPDFPYLGLAFVVVTCVVAGFNYTMYSSYGGVYVAEDAGGVRVPQNTTDPKLRQLLNIVEEMSLAAGLPVPPVYIIQADQINAFAAGMTPENGAVAVTVGCLRKLNRDELQGVIAHELGHLYNRDSKVSLRVAALVAGFFVLMYLGFRFLQFAPARREGEKGPPVALIALIFIVAGAISWMAGKILSACVSREREYLADACSVQFTRNPDGIVGALKKIGQDQISDMPKQGMAYQHLYFNDKSFLGDLLATHPSLDKRIEAITGHRYTFDNPPPGEHIPG